MFARLLSRLLLITTHDSASPTENSIGICFIAIFTPLIFVISDKKFAGVEKQQWKLEKTDTLYVDRIKISKLASKAIYYAIYDFLVINTNERGAKNLRVKIETDALLTTVLLMEESYLFVGQEDGFSFFEINVENYE